MTTLLPRPGTDPPGGTAPARGMFHFRFLAVAHAVASYGNFLNMVALSLFAYQVTGSALHTGLFMALRIGSGFLMGFGTGQLVSRFCRKRIMVVVNLVQAAAMTVLLLTPAAVTPLLYVVAVVIGAGGTVMAVALRSAVPEIVGSERRVAGNGWLTAGRSVAMVAGFASSGVLIATGGYGSVFAVNIGAFLLAAAIVAALPIRTRSAAEQPGAGRLHGHRVAVALFAASPVLMGMLAVRAIVNIGAAAANVSIPIHSTALNPSSPATFMAQFWTVWAVGNIVAQLELGRRSRRTGHGVGEWTFVAGACVMSAASVFVFTGWPLAAVLAAALVTGAASGVAENGYHSRLQEAPDAQRGHLFGLSLSAENLSFGTGMVVAATLLDHVTPLPVVATISTVTIVAALGFAGVLLGVRGRDGSSRRSQRDSSG
ncbi:MAG: MFS transporter [Micromonosporaceae bacterium]